MPAGPVPIGVAFALDRFLFQLFDRMEVRLFADIPVAFARGNTISLAPASRSSDTGLANDADTESRNTRIYP